MVSIPKRISSYADYLSQDQFKPQREFMRLALAAYLAVRSPVLMQIAGELMTSKGAWKAMTHLERLRELDTNEHYLSEHMKNPRLDMSKVLERHFELIGPLLLKDGGQGVNIAVDGTDFKKQWARPHRPCGMKGATKVRDGSASTRERATLVMGYPGLTIEASLPSGNQVPVLHWLYSRADRDPLTNEPFRSDEATLWSALRRVRAVVGPNAFVTFDEGFAGAANLREFDALGLRWVVRLQGTGVAARRWVRTEDGIDWHLNDLVARVPLTVSRRRVMGRAKEVIDLQMGIVKVYLREESSKENARWQDRARTLVVVQVNGAAKMMVLLVNDWMGATPEMIEMIRAEYRRRWRIEESHRLSKDSRGWGWRIEDFRVLSLRAIQRTVLLLMLAAGFIANLRAEDPGDAARLAERAFAPGPTPRDPRYRLNYVVGQMLKHWLQTTFVRRGLVPPGGRDPPDSDTLISRLKNARRCAKRLERELLAFGIALPV